MKERMWWIMTSLAKRSTALLLILSMLFTGLMGSSRVQAEADAESANQIVFEDFENGAPDDYSVAPEPPFDVHVMETTSATPLTIAGYRASGSDSNIPEYAIDGDIQTRWSAYDDGQWIELDLGSEQLVSYLGVAFYRGDNRSKTIDIEVSNDQTNWTRIYSGDSSGTTIQVEAFGFEAVTARYVRVVGRGASEWTSISEIQIYPPHVDGFILRDVEIPPTGPDPDSPIPTKAGLYYADGAPHVPHEAQTVTALRIMSWTSAPILPTTE